MGISRQRVRVERFREFEVELSCLICVKHFVLEANESPNQVVNDEVLGSLNLVEKDMSTDVLHSWRTDGRAALYDDMKEHALPIGSL